MNTDNSHHSHHSHHRHHRSSGNTENQNISAVSSESDALDLDVMEQEFEEEIKNAHTEGANEDVKTHRHRGRKHSGQSKEEKKKMKRWKKVLLIILCVLLFLLLLGAGIAYAVFYHYYAMLDRNNEEVEEYTGEEDETDSTEDSLTDEELAALEERMNQDLDALNDYVSDGDTSNLYNILIIGVDSREDNFSGRSDMMMLITINRSSKKIVVTSLLRDMYVTISGYKSNRINASYAFGGASLLISTIKQNLGITVDDYVIVNFYSIVSLIDYIGGVDINVTAEEIPYINGYAAGQASQMGYSDTSTLSESDAGLVHLNGNQALAYGRIRYIGTDFARTERQRTVALAALSKVQDMSFSSLNGMAETYLPQLRTSLSQTDCLSLITLLLSIGDYSIDTMTIPQDGTWSNVTIRKMAVLSVDFTTNYQAWLAAVQ